MNFVDSDLLRKNVAQVASHVQSVLEDEPLLEETKARLENVLAVAHAICEELSGPCVSKQVLGRTRRFLVVVSELVLQLIDDERNLRATRHRDSCGEKEAGPHS